MIYGKWAYKLALATFLAGCAWAPAGSADAPSYWPTSGWKSSAPEAQGMNSARLTEAVRFARESNIHLHSLLVVRHGYVVLDAYFYPFQRGQLHDVASVTKSFTSTLVGMAVAQHKIADLDRTALGFFPEKTAANLSQAKEAITLRTMLTMRAGLVCVNQPTEKTLLEMQASKDWIQFVIDRPMASTPGTTFTYDSTVSHLLSVILHRATGEKEEAFATSQLFGPLGITEYIWPCDPTGTDNHGWGDLHITPDSMAKLGLLYLNDGVWDGKRLLPEGWAAAATTAQATFQDDATHTGYGYQWWVTDKGYQALGRGGQHIDVYRTKDLVVVMTSGGLGPRPYQVLSERILSAVESDAPLPNNDSGVASLESAVRAASAEPQVQKTDPKRPPRIARRASGKVYAMAPNPLGITKVMSEFTKGGDASVTITSSTFLPGAEHKIAIPTGMDNVARISPGRYGLPAAAKGAWDNANALVVDYDEIGNINRWRIRLEFSSKDLTLSMREITGLGSFEIKGTQAKS
ncbi:MAG: serine hydrolase [Candidatus Hydrogenedentes bacterium]|nr:serine hydrolase [Candidatus Hydrogenedentota bacterium]